MATGLRIKNAYGSTQVDERYSGLGCTTSGTVALTPSTGAHPNPMVVGSVTVTGSNPLIAIACAYPVNVVQITQSGSSWTFHLRSQAYQNLTVSYWIFDNADRIPAPAAGTHNLVVRNPANGQVVFHGNMRPLRLVETITPGFGGWDQRTVPGGRAYAVIQGAAAFRFTSTLSDRAATIPDPGWDVYDQQAEHSASRVNGNVISAGLYTYESYQNQQPDGTANSVSTYGNLSFWIVDVTGYGGAIPSADYTPAAVNWANISGTTTANTGSAQNATQTISGIDQPITLRATVSSVTGNLSSGTLYMRNSSGTVLASLSLTSPGYIEAQVTNGMGVYFSADAATTSGTKTGGCTVTVQNMSDQNTVLDTFTVSQTVDSDNNYNVGSDVTPNAMAFNNIYSVTDDQSSSNYASGNTVTVSGITASSITLQIDFSMSGGASGSGASASGSFYLNKNGVSAAYASIMAIGSNTGTHSETITVSSGDTLQFTGDVMVSTMSGYGSGSATANVTIKNVSDSNAVLDTLSITVGASTSGGAM